MKPITVVGGGLAGTECALSLAARGIPVRLLEMRPSTSSPAHHTADLAELVCSNSLKSCREDSAAGTLKAELDLMGSRLLALARKAQVPAGGALAVDRAEFSQLATEAVEREPLIELRREEVSSIPDGISVICTGPLCADSLAQDIQERLGESSLAFFDAAAPIVEASSLDRTIVFSQSRYQEDDAGDYLNCPFDKASYEAFWEELVAAERVIARDFETRDLFQACQPVEEVARKGRDTLRFGALKPVGITDPRSGRRPWAVVQLRAENRERTAYNLVGFQTNLTWGAQRRVFSMIPGLEHAEFSRFGVMHRNTFVNAPAHLTRDLRLKGTDTFFAGQISGTEGYVEAIASGCLAAANVAARVEGRPCAELPKTTVFGALIAYATDPDTRDYQPMHVNFGLMPPLDPPIRSKRERMAAYAARARHDLTRYLEERPDLFADAAGKPLSVTAGRL